MIEHRDIRLDAALMDKPGEVLGRTVRGVGGQSLRVAEQFAPVALRPDHGEDVGDPDRSGERSRHPKAGRRDQEARRDLVFGAGFIFAIAMG
jgi:hypothetical protein